MNFTPKKKITKIRCRHIKEGEKKKAEKNAGSVNFLGEFC